MQMYRHLKVPLLRSFGSHFRDDNHYGRPSLQNGMTLACTPELLGDRVANPNKKASAEAEADHANKALMTARRHPRAFALMGINRNQEGIAVRV